MENKPLISVLLPCYNAEKFVTETINSVLAQTYTHFEIIAINDCSTDDTSRILHNLAEKDNRIKVHENESNLKLIKTLNKGIELCRGKYIARIDSDDIALPTRFEKQIKFLEKNEDYDILGTQFYTFISGSDKYSLYRNPLKYEDLQAYLLFHSGICHPSVMIRKRLFTEYGFRFEAEYLHVEDYALWSKALYKTKIANIDEPLLRYRIHPHQVSVMYNQIQLDNKKKVFRIHCEHWGLDTSDAALDIYTSVAESIPKYSTYEYLALCENFMLQLIVKNEEKKLCSQKYLKKLLSLHWIRLCANSRMGLKVLKVCQSSPLYDEKAYTKRNIFILYLKCLFRLEPEFSSRIYQMIYK